MRHIVYILIGAILALAAYSGVYLDRLGDAFQIAFGTIFFIFSLPWNILIYLLLFFIPENQITNYFGKEVNWLSLYLSSLYIGTIVGTFVNGYLYSKRIYDKYHPKQNNNESS